MEITPQFMVLVLALVGGALFLFLREVTKTPAMIFAGLTFYSALSKQVSVLYLEGHRSYISESGTISFDNGAFWRLLIFHAVMFGAAAVVARYLAKRSAATRIPGSIAMPPRRKLKIAISVVAGVLGLQALNLALSSGVPLPGADVTRWTYWESHAGLPFLALVFGKLMVFIPFVMGIAYFATTRAGLDIERRATIVCILGYTAYLVLTGQRFHGFLSPYVLFGGIYLIHRVMSGRSIVYTKFTVYTVIALGILLSYGVIVMQFRGISVFAGGAVSGLLYRVFVLQGHAYWNVDVLVSQYGALGHAGDMLNGMETLIQAIGKTKVVYGYLTNNINFSAGLPTITIYVFGYLMSVPLVALYGAVLGVMIHLLYWCVRSGSIMIAFPASYLWLWTHSVYAHASLESLVSPKFAVFGLAVVVALFIDSKRRQPAGFRPSASGPRGMMRGYPAAVQAGRA